MSGDIVQHGLFSFFPNHLITSQGKMPCKECYFCKIEELNTPLAKEREREKGEAQAPSY